jgi:hypothetical protein
MVKELLIRSLQILACAILFSGGAVANLRAEPITVTSGVFVISDDDPNFFRFFGANGFALHGGFVPVPASPKATCDFPLPGCLPGTSLNLSAVAGGAVVPFGGPFTLGNGFDSNVNGTPFFQFPGPQGRLVGTLRFDAPSVVLPSIPEGAITGPGFAAPFLFSGHVTGFAREDVDQRAPLFDVELVGQGTLTLGFDSVFNGRYSTVEERFTFAATPEPSAVLLLATGLCGLLPRQRAAPGARGRQRQRGPCVEE